MIPKQLEEAIKELGAQLVDNANWQSTQDEGVHRALGDLEAAISAHVAERVREAIDARSDDAGKAAGWDQASQDMDDAEVPPASFPNRVRWLIERAEQSPPTDAEVEAWVKRMKEIPCECGLQWSIEAEDIEAGVALMRRAKPAATDATGPSALDRLRERVAKKREETGMWECARELAEVLDMIDEEAKR